MPSRAVRWILLVMPPAITTVVIATGLPVGWLLLPIPLGLFVVAVDAFVQYWGSRGPQAENRPSTPDARELSEALTSAANELERAARAIRDGAIGSAPRS